MVFEKFAYCVNCLNPNFFEKVFSEKKGTENLVEGIKNVFFASFVPAIIVGTLMVVIGLFFSAFFAAIFAAFSNSSSSSSGIFGIGVGLFYVVFGVIAAILSLIVTPISFLVSQGITWVISRVLGGKGSFTDQSFYSSFFTAGHLIIYPVLLIPCIGSAFGVILLLLSLYLQYLVVRNVHQLSPMRSAAVVLLPIAVFIALYLLLYLFLFAVSGASTTYSPTYY